MKGLSVSNLFIFYPIFHISLYDTIIKGDYMLLQLIGIFVTVLVVYLIASYLISKNNSEIVYEEDMDEEELKSLDDEIND